MYFIFGDNKLTCYWWSFLSVVAIGNLLMLPDGRVGLIDFGQVKRLDDSGKLFLAQIVETLAEGLSISPFQSLHMSY